MASVLVLPLVGFALCLCWAAVSDLRHYLIPNRVSLALLALFPLAFGAADLPWSALGAHLLHGGAAFVLGFVLFALGKVGGGDAKLFAATALWMDGDAGFALYLYTALAGGVVALVFAVLAYLRFDADLRGWARFAALPFDKLQLPYGVAIAAGGLLAIPRADVFVALLPL